MKFLLYAPQRIENIAAITRTLEFFGYKEILIFDKFNLIREKYGNRYERTINSYSSGAFWKMDFIKIEEPLVYLKEYPYRKIGTSVHSQGTNIDTFSFKNNDLVIFGNETLGLNQDILLLTDHIINIHGKGKTESLNLSVCLGIIAHKSTNYT